MIIHSSASNLRPQNLQGAPLIMPVSSIPTHLPPPQTPNLAYQMSHLAVDPSQQQQQSQRLLRPLFVQQVPFDIMAPSLSPQTSPSFMMLLPAMGRGAVQLPGQQFLQPPVFRPISIRSRNQLSQQDPPLIKSNLRAKLNVVISPIAVEERDKEGNGNLSDSSNEEHLHRTNSAESSMCDPSTSSSCSPSENASSGDSGRATGGLASSLSPMEEPNYDNMPMYEFEIPNSLVGLIIGIKGKTIRELSVRTNVKMLIRQHHTPEKVNTHQICQVRGKREEINHCLSMLRRRFPPLRFPELNLNPVLPPLLSNGFVDALHTQPTWLTLPENVPCEVVVSSIMSPSHFFLQQPTHPTYASLSLLDMYMMRLYSQDVDIPELPAPCQDGLLCAAPVGGNWLRAVTFGHDAEKDDVSIRYVDYGGYGRLKRSELRQIRTDLMSLPFQSTECYLAYVQPVDGTRVWSDAAVEFFKNLVLGRLITATLVGYHVEDRMPMIELLVQNEEKKAIRLDTALMEKGYAKAADPSKMQRLNTLQRQQSQGQQNGVPPPPNQQSFQHQMQHPPPPLIQGMQNGHTPHQQQGHQNGIAPLINGTHQPKRPVYTSQQYGHHSGHSGSHHSTHTHAAHNQPHPQAVNKQHRQNF